MGKNIIVELTNERIIPSGGLAVVGAILGKSDFVKNCNNMKVDCNHPQHQIKNGDVLLTYIGMQCMGKPSFDAVHEMDDDPDFYKAALGICYGIPSAETLRQRLDLIGSSIRVRILDENVRMLKSNGIVPSKLPCGYVPVDMDARLSTTRIPARRACPGLIKAATATPPCSPILAARATLPTWS